MSGFTAGYVDAGPVIASTLSELATRRPPVPVSSLYLDLDPSEFGTQAARLASGEGAVANLDGVGDALGVETLLYGERHARSESVLENAIEEAVVQSAEILPLCHAPETLDQYGHVAAVLRF